MKHLVRRILDWLFPLRRPLREAREAREDRIDAAIATKALAQFDREEHERVMARAARFSGVQPEEGRPVYEAPIERHTAASDAGLATPIHGFIRTTAGPEALEQLRKRGLI